MSQDIIIDNIIMTILFILVLKKKNYLLIPTTSIQWSPFSYEIPIPHFFYHFFTSSTTTKREKHSDMKPTCYLELTWSI